MKGTVKFMNEEKGYGFIVPEDGSKDVFVHKSAIEGVIVEGDEVEFEVQDTDRGKAAANVRKA